MTIGTRLYTLLKGTLVGIDSSGNRYYRNRGRHLHGRERRWVIYKGDTEASKVPPEWHAWLHHTTEAPLMEQAAGARSWQRAREPNPTGTPMAVLPRGHDRNQGRHAATGGDYQPWSPE